MAWQVKKPTSRSRYLDTEKMQVKGEKGITRQKITYRRNSMQRRKSRPHHQHSSKTAVLPNTSHNHPITRSTPIRPRILPAPPFQTSMSHHETALETEGAAGTTALFFSIPLRRAFAPSVGPAHAPFAKKKKKKKAARHDRVESKFPHPHPLGGGGGGD